MSRYEKPALTFEDQADQLIERGLEADPLGARFTRS